MTEHKRKRKLTLSDDGELPGDGSSSAPQGDRYQIFNQQKGQDYLKLLRDLDLLEFPITCKQCGTENPVGGEKFCKQCGAWLVKQQPRRQRGISFFSDASIGTEPALPEKPKRAPDEADYQQDENRSGFFAWLGSLLRSILDIFRP